MKCNTTTYLELISRLPACRPHSTAEDETSSRSQDEGGNHGRPRWSSDISSYLDCLRGVSSLRSTHPLDFRNLACYDRGVRQPQPFYRPRPGSAKDSVGLQVHYRSCVISLLSVSCAIGKKITMSQDRNSSSILGKDIGWTWCSCTSRAVPRPVASSVHPHPPPRWVGCDSSHLTPLCRAK